MKVFLAKMPVRLAPLVRIICREGATGSFVGGGERFGQPDELCHFADLFRERFTGQFLSHLGFHGFGSFSL